MKGLIDYKHKLEEDYDKMGEKLDDLYQELDAKN